MLTWVVNEVHAGIFRTLTALRSQEELALIRLMQVTVFTV